jgi:ABC-type nitrate/sulfonate/bicarbonate transport system permease component
MESDGGAADVRNWLRGTVLVMAAAAVLVMVWQAAVTAYRVPAYLVPAPDAVWHSAVLHWQVLLRQTGTTLGAASLGLLVSSLFAAGAAMLFTVSRDAEQAMTPLLLAFRTAPVAAVAPLIMLFTGRGIATSVVVVTIVSFFPIFVNLRRGLVSVERGALELFHVHDASVWQQVVLLRLPAALPFLFTGLRVAAGSAVLGAMLSEWITGTRGLGNLILESSEMREVELLWSAVVTAVISGLVVFGLTSLGEARATRWRRAGARTG